MIRVLIVDNEWMVRAMLGSILGAHDDIDIVGEAVDGADAVREATRLQPDVVMMDIRMPCTDGLTATEDLARMANPPKVVVLTTFDLDEYVATALRNGAVGFLLKDATAEQMVGAVRSAAAGDAMLSPQITRRLLHRFSTPVSPQSTLARQHVHGLTDKEREVLTALGQGLPNSEIARRLHLSEATVKNHVTRILAKLNLTNRVQAAILAHHAGLVN